MKKMWVVLAMCAGMALLAGCGTMQPTGGGAAPVTAEQQLADAQRTVFNLQQAYNGVVSVMLVYKSWPRCGTPNATQLCSRQDVVDQLKAADNIAFEALQAAQDVVRSPGAGANAQTALLAAQKAMTALQSIAATLPKQ